ncbi:helix-turn-helix domain-containing protein [Diplocloster hominis]|uniref:helix-turn-helix domain-containing protein n=1 Tax=Diplocloster hominis TaxID=3079010 RepID=UPI0031BA0173
MVSKFVRMEYSCNENIWAGKYRNLHNLPHWHKEHELIYVNSGTAKIHMNQNCYQAGPKDCFFCSGGDTHRISGSQDSIISTILFNTACAQSIVTQYTLCSPRLVHTYPIESFYNNISRELTQQQPFFQVKTDMYISDLIVDIFRKEETRPYEDRSQIYEKYKTLLTLLNENYEYITFEDAASIMGFTKPYFSKFFKNMFGMTFSSYMQILRVEHAIQLLSEGQMTLTEVSAKCGFNSIRTFNRVFKTLTGTTPKSVSRDVRLDTYTHKNLSGIYDPTLQISEYLKY